MKRTRLIDHRYPVRRFSRATQALRVRIFCWSRRRIATENRALAAADRKMEKTEPK
jgi:hypothetical protein